MLNSLLRRRPPTADASSSPLLLAAPDSFKGTFSAPDAARAMAAAAQRSGWKADECPVADGGEGTTEVLLAARGGATRPVTVTGPLGAPVSARLALLADGATAVVEMAAASGLNLVPEAERDAERASSFGTGELILAARDAGATTILLGAGGSATSDGGLGAIAALDEGGGLRGVELRVLCDVMTPYERAATVFGPQKGAGEDAVARLTRRLHSTARSFRRDPRGRPWTGCGGGLSGALWAAHGAELVPGARAVLTAIGFDERLAKAGMVVTGEGRIDAQSLSGKVTGEVVRRGLRLGVPVHAVVGRDALESPVTGLRSVVEAGTLEAIGAAVCDVISASG